MEKGKYEVRVVVNVHYLLDITDMGTGHRGAVSQTVRALNVTFVMTSKHQRMT